MTRTDMKDLVVGLFSAYRPDIDVTEGSSFYLEFLTPLLDRLSVDDTVTEKFVLDQLEQAFPDVDFRSRGGALSDMFRKVPSALLDGIIQNLRLIRQERAGLADPSKLTADSASDLAGNFFVQRVTAGYSTVMVRMYFSTPVRTVLFTDNTARTSAGQLFIPATVTEIAIENMRQDGSLYYIDVLFVAQQPGSAYQIEPNAIFTVDGVPGLVKATNLLQSSRVNDDEPPEALASRTLDSITDHAQVIKRGIRTAVTEGVPLVAEAQVIGFNDPEMKRDVLTANIEWLSNARPTRVVEAGTYSLAYPLFPGAANYENFSFTNRLFLGDSQSLVTLSGVLTSKVFVPAVPLTDSLLSGLMVIVIHDDNAYYTVCAGSDVGLNEVYLADDLGFSGSVTVDLVVLSLSGASNFHKGAVPAYVSLSDPNAPCDRGITFTEDVNAGLRQVVRYDTGTGPGHDTGTVTGTVLVDNTVDFVELGVQVGDGISIYETGFHDDAHSEDRQVLDVIDAHTIQMSGESGYQGAREYTISTVTTATVPVHTLDDFSVLIARDILVQSYTVAEGASLLQPPCATYTGTEVTVDGVLPSGGDKLVTLDADNNETVYTVATTLGDSVWTQSEFAVLAAGGADPVTLGEVVGPYDGSFWLRVPSSLQLYADPTSGNSVSYLSLERVDPPHALPLWLEYSGTNAITEVLDAEYHGGIPGCSDLRLPDFATYGVLEGATTRLDDVDVAGLALLNAGDTFLWTYWTGKTATMVPPITTRGMADVLHSVAVRLNIPESKVLRVRPAFMARGWVLRVEDSNALNYVLSVSGIPGGILFPDVPITPDSPQGRLYVEPDTVHIGGKTDVYVSLRTDYARRTTVIDELRDQNSPVSGDDLQLTNCSALSSEFTATSLSKVDFRCASLSYYNDPVFENVRAVSKQSNLVVTDHEFLTPVTGARFYLSSPYVEYDMLNPRIVKVRGSDLRTYVYSRIATTARSLETVVSSSVPEEGDVLRILSEGQNKGIYTIVGVNAVTGSLFLDREPPVSAADQTFEVCKVSQAFPLPVVRCTSVNLVDAGGEISIPHGKPLGILAYRDFVDGCGTVRVYFKDPTFFYAKGMVFQSRGRNYVCTDKYTLYTSDPMNLGVSVTGGTRVLEVPEGDITTSLLSNCSFLAGNAQNPPPTVKLLYRPIFTKYSTNAELSVSGLTLRMRVGTGAPMRSMTFVGPNPLPMSDPSSGLGGVIQQINEFFPGVTAVLDTTSSPGSSRVVLTSAVPIVIGPGSANINLGGSFVDGNTNAAANAGVDFTIDTLSPLAGPTFTGTELRMSSDSPAFLPEGTGGVVFTIEDVGPIVFPSMMQLEAETGLYYVDVHVVPDPNQTGVERTGTDMDAVRNDEFVLMQPDTTPPMVYYGYHLHTEEPSLAYSVVENLKLRVSAWFFDPSANDICGQRYFPASQRLSVTCDYCPATGATQYLLRGGDSRIVVADPLAKAARPAWVLGTVIYSGGEDTVSTAAALQAYVRNIRFGQYLDISDVRSVFTKRGATGFLDPTTLTIVVQGEDRGYSMVRLTDRFQPARVVKLVPETALLTVSKTAF